MNIKKSLGVGILGFIIFLSSSFFYTSITGAVVGANKNSKFIAILGIFLMIFAIVIERYESKK